MGRGSWELEKTLLSMCRDAFGGHEVLDLLWVPHALSQSCCHSNWLLWRLVRKVCLQATSLIVK